MTDKEDTEQPELNITDDLHESVQLAEPTLEAELIPVVSTEAEPTSQPSSPAVVGNPNNSFKHKLAAFLKTKKGKITAVVVGLVVLFGVLFAIPATRYAIAGVFIKKDVTLTVIDQDSKKPVSSATVTLATYTGQTDSQGKVTLPAVPVGEYQLRVEKKYYATTTSDYLVPIFSAPPDTQPQLKATGRNVHISVTNKITGAAVSGASVNVSGSTAVSDDNGVASIVLPVKPDPQAGTVKAPNYNDSSFEVVVSSHDDQHVSAPLTPSGQVFFLSKRTGKIDVMKSNLDGSSTSVVLAGTGRESDTSTVLLSTTDWKYLALLATRDSAKPKLYLIDTASGKLSTMEGDAADTQLIGWSGHQFVYELTHSQDLWTNKRQALRSYNAESAKAATLDETQGSGTNYSDYASQTIDNVYVVGSAVVYAKTWITGQAAPAADRKAAIMSVDVGGSNKKSLKDFSLTEATYFDSRLYEPGGIYYRASNPLNDQGKFYAYGGGKLTETADTNDQKFYNSFYPTYLTSPSGKKTLWSEPRDGKNVVFVGDANGNNGREVGTSDYVPYGWYADEYILLSKGGSELYVMGAGGTIDADHKPLKVTDYHKPALMYPGYGGQ